MTDPSSFFMNWTAAVVYRQQDNSSCVSLLIIVSCGCKTVYYMYTYTYICTRAKRVPHHGLVALFDGAHSSNIDARTRRRSILGGEGGGESRGANCAAMASILSI